MSNVGAKAMFYGTFIVVGLSAGPPLGIFLGGSVTLAAAIHFLRDERIEDKEKRRLFEEMWQQTENQLQSRQASVDEIRAMRRQMEIDTFGKELKK